jgi:uncharacterized membrane protein
MRLLYTLLLFVHLIGVMVWVGGMAVLHFAVRPAAIAQLPPPQRLPLLANVLQRFFFWVALAIVAIIGSGIALILGAGGFGAAHVSVHVMLALGLLMVAIFLRVRLGPFPRLLTAVSMSDWPIAASHLDTIRRLVVVNLTLGVITSLVATVGRALL